MSSSNELEALCRTVYAETREFYAYVERRLGGALGFRILYGPPLQRPPILFLGYQPGGRVQLGIQSERDTWPEECEYATETWPLAKNMQGMFTVPLLKQCTGLNVIFIRAPNMQEYQRWLSRAPGLRHEIEQFCLPRAKQLIEAMEPEKIVAIGFPSLELFGALQPVLTNRTGRVLVKDGRIGNRKALATLHLSGARISLIDRQSIVRFVLDA